jgi:hypothetical protein
MSHLEQLGAASMRPIVADRSMSTAPDRDCGCKLFRDGALCQLIEMSTVFHTTLNHEKHKLSRIDTSEIDA